MSKATKRGKMWRVRVYDYTDEQGKVHVRSFSGYSKAEAELKAAMFRGEKERRVIPRQQDLTVGEAVDCYIELKALLSPTTLTAYRRIRKYAFPRLMPRKVSKLTDADLQLAVNEETERIGPNGKPLSAKTVKNEYALISGALREVCHLQFSVTLPKVQRHIKDLPEAADVMAAIIGTDIELPCLLALWLSFSMSEIRGLMASDVKDGYITINRTRVDTDQGPIIKETAKVENRLRRHKLPPYILSLITCSPVYKNWLRSGNNGLLVPFNRKTIYEKWTAACKRAGLGDLSFHDLRHVNCSVMASLQISEKVMQERGGWKSSFVPKSVYTHTFGSDRLAADAKIDTFFEAALAKLDQNT